MNKIMLAIISLSVCLGLEPMLIAASELLQPPTCAHQAEIVNKLAIYAQIDAIAKQHRRPSTLEGHNVDGNKLVSTRLAPVVLDVTAILPSNRNTIVRQAPALCQMHETAGVPDVTNYCGYFAASNAYNLASNRSACIMDRMTFSINFHMMLLENENAMLASPYDNIDENGVRRNIHILEHINGPLLYKIAIMESEGLLPFVLIEPTQNRPQEIIDFIEKRSQNIVLIYGYGALQKDGLGGQQHWVTVLAEQNSKDHKVFLTIYDSLLNDWLTPRFMNSHLKYIDELLRGIQDESLLESF